MITVDLGVAIGVFFKPLMDPFLSKVEIFKHLTPVQRQRLTIVTREKKYAKGETIFREGEPAESLFIVKTGRVHLMNFLDSGQATTTCVLAPGESFCCLPALDQQPYPADAVAAVDSVVVRIPTKTFHEFMQQNPQFLQDSLCHFCSRLREVEHKSCTMHESVERRLAQALLSLSQKFGNTIPLTKHEIAEMASTTVETTIRVLSQFKKDGIIKSSRGSTTIAKPEKLRILAGA